MDILDKDRQIIYKALKYYADLPYWCQDVKTSRGDKCLETFSIKGSSSPIFKKIRAC